MTSYFDHLRNILMRSWKAFLDVDSLMIGLVICGFAIHAWFTFYDGVSDIILYYSVGVWVLPSLASLSILASAIYLSGAAFILLSQDRPIAKYHSVTPNLIALLAGFGVYSFIWLPSGNLLNTNTYLCISFTVLGTSSIIISMIFLRHAFSVTPQARYVITSGPYRYLRHPMYVANIVSLLGLALLVNTGLAFILFIFCSLLQILRARYEEKILEQSFEEYRSYKASVGGFIPKMTTLGRLFWTRFMPLVAAMLANISLAAALGSQPQNFHRMETIYIQLVKTLDAVATTKLCNKWYNKALSGEWFSDDEQKEMFSIDMSGHGLDSIQGCKQYVALNGKCQSIVFDWEGLGDGPQLNDSVFIHKLETQAGCTYLAGLDNVCKAQEGMAKRGVHLTDDELSLMPDCFDKKIRQRRVEFLRPAE